MRRRMFSEFSLLVFLPLLMMLLMMTIIVSHAQEETMTTTTTTTTPITVKITSRAATKEFINTCRNVFHGEEKKEEDEDLNCTNSLMRQNSFCCKGVAVATRTTATTAENNYTPVLDHQQENHQASYNDDSSSSSSSPLLSSSSTCNLFLAESTVPNAGLGVFAGPMGYDVNELVGWGDVCLPIMDIHWHASAAAVSKQGGSGGHLVPYPYQHYQWVGSSMGMQRDVPQLRQADISAMCLGMGASTNSDPRLVNVDSPNPQFEIGGGGNSDSDSSTASKSRQTFLNRANDPGVGAFTPYWNATTVATQSVPPGGELFLNYGSDWFQSRLSWLEKEGTLFPFREHYELVRQLLLTMKKITTVYSEKEENEGAGGEQTEFPEKKIVDEAASERVFSDLYHILIDTHQTKWTDRTLAALPLDPQIALKALRDYDGDVGRATRQPSAIRDLSYLQEEGRCLDNLRPGQSSLPHGRQAGHGAFATRHLSKGQIITTSPLHHFPYKEQVVNMYGPLLDETNSAARATATTENNTKTSIKPDPNKLVGKQILLNYCFSHPQSTLLLCPYGHGVNYINHAAPPTITTDDSSRGAAAAGSATTATANVAIRWAITFPQAHNHSIVQSSTIHKLAQSDKPLLAFDYVTLRDISPGEEVLLDYGSDWQTAWQQHIKTFKERLSSLSSSSSTTAMTQWKQYQLQLQRLRRNQSGGTTTATTTTAASKQQQHHQKKTLHPAWFWNEIVLQNHEILLRTEDEQQYDPYPPHLELHCRHPLFEKSKEEGEAYDDDDNEGSDQSSSATTESTTVPCRIINRTVTGDDQYDYHVQFDASARAQSKTEATQETRVLFRSFIFFVDREVSLSSLSPSQKLQLEQKSGASSSNNNHYNYNYKNDAKHYLSARGWNQIFQNNLIRTREEQRYDPYPQHLQIRCMRKKNAVVPLNQSDHFDERDAEDSDDDNDNNNERVSERRGGVRNGSYNESNNNSSASIHHGYEWVDEPCRIINRKVMHDVDYRYAVEIINSTNGSTIWKTSLKRNGSDQQVDYGGGDSDDDEWLSRDQIIFIDQPLSTDIHLRDAFRHWIGIPDDIFPEHWKNLKQGYTFVTNKPVREVKIKKASVMINRRK